MDLGAATHEKLSAILLSTVSCPLKREAVELVMSINTPLPTIDTDMYALRSLSLIAGVLRNVNISEKTI